MPREITATKKALQALAKERPDIAHLTTGIDGWKARFLVALAESGTVGRAAKLAGTTSAAVRYNRQRDRTFDLRCNEAIQIALEKMESIYWSAALGELDGKPNLPAIQFWLKTHKPEIYGEKSAKLRLTAPTNNGTLMMEQTGSVEQLKKVLETLAHAGALPQGFTMELMAESKTSPDSLETYEDPGNTSE